MNIITHCENDVFAPKVNISMTLCVFTFSHRGQHGLIENRCIIVYRSIGKSERKVYRPLDFNVVEIFLHNA